MDSKPKAALYFRVSTAEQAVEGFSMQVQKEKLSQYATAMNYEIFGYYSDDGFSGKSLFRPAVERLITDIKCGKIDIVLIYKLDRLSRRVKDVLELVEMFEQHKVALYSLNENLDLSSPFGRAALKMSATFSELERETILERMQMGKSARAKLGKYSCPGRAPFGYIHDKDNDRFIVNPIEAEAVKKIFDLYIGHGYSVRKLYLYCKENYPDLHYFSNEMCCKPILLRVMYAGYFRYKDELIKGTNFEPIISYETFLQAQARIAENRTKRLRENTPNMLAGLILCGKCGNRYVGKLYDRYNYKKDGTRTKSYKYRCYGCAARVKHDKNYHPADCDNPIIPVEDLDRIIAESVKKLNLSKLSEGNFATGLIDHLLMEQATLKDRQNKLLDLYLDSTIDKDTYTLRLVEIESKLNENKSLIENEKDKVVSRPANSVETIKDRIQNFDDLDRLEKTKLLRFLIKNIVIDGETPIINWNIK